MKPDAPQPSPGLIVESGKINAGDERIDMAGELVFYTNPMSRGRTVRWMLEEVGRPLPHRAPRFRRHDEIARLSRDQPHGKGAGHPSRRHRGHRGRRHLRLPGGRLPRGPGWRRRRAIGCADPTTAGCFSRPTARAASGFEAPAEGSRAGATDRCGGDARRAEGVDRFSAAPAYLEWWMQFGLLDNARYVARAARPAAARAKPTRVDV